MATRPIKRFIGNKVIPGWLDKYLGKTGYKGQQTGEPKDPDRQNNLWESIPGDHGAHGPFTKRYKHGSPILFAKKNKWMVAAALSGLIIGAAIIKNNL